MANEPAIPPAICPACHQTPVQGMMQDCDYCQYAMRAAVEHVAAILEKIRADVPELYEALDDYLNDLERARG